MYEAPLINIRDLSIGFKARDGRTLPVIRNIDLQVGRGQSVGIVGESGSGKSTLALAAMGYLKRGLQVIGGSASFAGQDLLTLASKDLEAIRGGKLALIPQNAGQALTPNLRIGAQIDEALRLHSACAPAERRPRAFDLLRRVRLPDPAAILQRYPHELSGGQQQRVAIAMALAGEPEALLLDEPTTGLDVTIQAHILELLHDLARSTGTAMVYVSHDLGAIARVCERVVVMYAGEIVLDGDATEVLTAPAHPYARGLLAAIPRLNEARLPAGLDGSPPAPGQAGSACAFADRCALAETVCRAERPKLASIDERTRARCHFHQRAMALRLRPESSEMPPLQPPSDASALALTDVSISYAKPNWIEQLTGRRPAAVPTVDGISIDIRKGETFALVGESGSGKSTILKAMAGLVPLSGGRITASDGSELQDDVGRRRADQLRTLQLIFQNPDESLNPRHTVAQILAQPLNLYFGMEGKELHRRSAALLETVRLGPHYLDRLPGQMSGGEKQRVAIARAFAAAPDLVLCDEVTSALDVSVQAAVLGLLDRLRRERGIAYVFVSHDLGVVRALADRVAVLYQGRICELGPTDAVYAPPFHPYTEALLGAVLEPVPGARPKLLSVDVAELAPPPCGCPFQRRCQHRIGGVCDTDTPPARMVREGHVICCHHPLETLVGLQNEAAAVVA